MTTLLPRIRKLVAALIGINGYAQHDDDCQADNASDTRRCTCGYRDAWKKAQQGSVLVPALLAEAERVQRFAEPPSEEVVEWVADAIAEADGMPGGYKHVAKAAINAYRKAVMEGK